MLLPCAAIFQNFVARQVFELKTREDVSPPGNENMLSCLREFLPQGLNSLFRLAFQQRSKNDPLWLFLHEEPDNG